jgi:hypothetical protein
MKEKLAARAATPTKPAGFFSRVLSFGRTAMLLLYFLFVMPLGGQDTNAQDSHNLRQMDVCGVTGASENAIMPSSCNYVPTLCHRVLKVNVTFLQRPTPNGIGIGNFTQNGPPMNVNNSGDTYYNSALPSNYSGYDYANDLIERLNVIYSSNVADNMCNGWYYYTNPTSIFYNPNFVMPTVPEPPMIQFSLKGVHFRASNTYYYENVADNYYNTSSNAGVLGVAAYDQPNEIEIFVFANGKGSGGIGYPIQKKVLIFGQMDKSGYGAAGLVAHELAHVLGLLHTFGGPSIPDAPNSDEPAPETIAAAEACPYYEPGYSICNPNPAPNFDGDDNSTCDSPVTVAADPTSVIYADIPHIQYSWQGYHPFIQVSNAPEAWKFTYGDEPEEFGNNIMSYDMGTHGMNFSNCQMIDMHNRIDSHLLSYLEATGVAEDIYPAVHINNGIETFCGAIGELVVLDAGNAAWNQPAYIWSTGETTPFIDVTISSTAAVYTVTVTTADGCRGIDEITVVGPSPTVSFPDPVVTTCLHFWDGAYDPGIFEHIVPTTTGNIASYEWLRLDEESNPPQWVHIGHAATNCPSCYPTGVDPNPAQFEDWTAPYIDLTVSGSGYASGGSGTYQVVVTSTNGCTASATFEFIAHQVPVFTISSLESQLGPTGTQACYDEAIPLSVSLTPTLDQYEPALPLSYWWTTEETTPNIDLTLDDGIGATSIYVTVTDANGCSATDGEFIWFLPNPDPTIIIDPNADCSATLSVNGGELYTWSNGSTTNSITVNESGTYSITVTQEYNDATDMPSTAYYDDNMPPHQCSAVGSVDYTTQVPNPPTLAALPTLCQTDAPIDLTQFVQNYDNLPPGYFIIVGTDGIPQTIEDDVYVFDPSQFGIGTYEIQFGYQTAYCDPAMSNTQTLTVEDCSPLGCAMQATYYTFANGALNFTAATGTDTWAPGSNPFGNATGVVYINGIITIPPNANITITGMHFRFGPNGKIDIQRRGNLTVRGNSVFEGNVDCGTMWQGFRVWGPGIAGVPGNNTNGEQIATNGTHQTGMLLFIDSGATSNEIAIRDAIIGVATTRLDNYDLATLANSLTQLNTGGAPFAINASTVSVLPQIAGPNNTQLAKSFGGGWLHISKTAGLRMDNCFYGALYAHYEGTTYINPPALANEGITGYKMTNASISTNGNLPYPFTGRSTEVGVGGINVLRTKITLEANKFLDPIYGIRANDVRLLIVRNNNDFENCIRGISTAVTSAGVNQFTRIEQNQFTDCRIAIQGDALQTSITGNTIMGPDNPSVLTAGILMRDSDFNIGGNVNGVETAGNFIDRVNFGIISWGGAPNPLLPAAAPDIKNNTITRSQVAIYALNDNSNLDITCNQLNYNAYGICVRSWNGMQGDLQDQGDCNNAINPIPAFNTFSLSNNNGLGYDLYRDESAEGFDYSDIGATNLSANEQDINRINCNPTTSPCNIYLPPGLEGLLAGITDDQTRQKIIARWLRQYQADSNEIAAIQLLEQNASLPLAAQKLVQQYYEAGYYEAAEGILDAMSLERIETQQFYDVQKLLISLRKEGKQLSDINAAQEQMLLDIANTHTFVAYRAQAMLYHARGYEFPVIIPPLPNSDSYGVTVFKTNNSVTTAKVQTFVPNPTTQTAYLSYELPDDSSATLLITDINGKIHQQATLVGTGTYSLDTQHLSSGLYLYSVEQNGKLLLRSKLAIIK